jgi:dinuclear metal center YbgI/SA1388 family protein
MTRVGDLVAWLEEFAPLSLAESWDNVGLLLGDRCAVVAGVMTCLTVTPTTAREALEDGAALIVSHHPILFRPIQRLCAGGTDGFVWQLARGGVAVYSPHTAFDNAPEGINAGLAARLGLHNVAPLRPSTGPEELKLVVFTPESDREAVLSAAFQAGAGRIGNYTQCSFGSEGTGTFFGEQGSQPTVGQAGRRESVPEWRLEIVCRTSDRERVLRAIREAHSYEEPAIDAYPLQPLVAGPGVGRIGQLEQPRSLGQFVSQVKDALCVGTGRVEVVGDCNRQVQRVAVACGAGDDFLKDAHRAGADVLLTGEARFHRGLEAEALGIGLVTAGHYATERPGVEDLAERLGRAFPGLKVWASRRERDPFAVLEG